MATPSNLPGYRILRSTVDRGLATITLNWPKQRKAIGGGMREELAATATTRCGSSC